MTRRQAAAYLLAQGGLGGLWWVLLFTAPSVRDLFLAPEGWPVARSLVVADAVGFVGGSALAGYAVLTERSWAPAATIGVVAITAYATLVAAAWVVAPVDRVSGLGAMVAALGGTLVAARVVLRP